MIFAIIGLLKQPVPPRDAAFEAALNAHLAQPNLRIVNAGYLRDAEQALIGHLALVETDSFGQAKAFLETSPFQTGGFYERTEIAEYDNEVGRLG
ncbi:hypothetical protein LJR225_003583 [Phenylobacterium sp. LjRoot225]|uniref:hypothetical protein n=1 Tax=Phenylobacterium sp. LjRoot225 TaxID=3342285 RepID=UPI003ED03106